MNLVKDLPNIGCLTDKSDSMNQVDSDCEYTDLYLKRFFIYCQICSIAKRMMTKHKHEDINGSKESFCSYQKHNFV